MHRTTRTISAAVALCAALGLSGNSALVASDDHGHGHHHGRTPIEFLGQAIVATGTLFDGTTIGGLSSIAYDRGLGVYYALSDDQASARFYTLKINLGDGRLDNGDVTFTKVTKLTPPTGETYAVGTFDPEGLTLTSDGDLIVTSEGIANSSIAPWVRRYSLNGTFLANLPVPAAFQPTSAAHGVRQNLGFESAAITPGGRFLFVGSEAAVVQDGPAATLTNGSNARLLRYDLARGKVDRQYVYVTDAIAEPPVPATNFAVNGLVEVLPLDEDSMLTMERSFSVGAPGTGNQIKIYRTSLEPATNVNGLDSITGVKRLKTVRKTLLFDLALLGIPLDNVEGMTLGPRLPDGRRSLILVSDNNFAATQFTQFLLFALDQPGHHGPHHSGRH